MSSDTNPGTHRQLDSTTATSIGRRRLGGRLRDDGGEGGDARAASCHHQDPRQRATTGSQGRRAQHQEGRDGIGDGDDGVHRHLTGHGQVPGVEGGRERQREDPAADPRDGGQRRTHDHVT